MGSYELTFPQLPLLRNGITGRYMKRHVPFNKGKRWSEYMTKFAQRKAAKGWANLDKFRRNGACAGWNKRPVVAITNEGVFIGKFESAAEAARCFGTYPRNINLCCQKKRKHAGKINNGRRLRWFYENDNEWLSHIKSDYFIRNGEK
jgi:hypothetical protein